MQANYSGKHVLVAPLDWGLGHATRCIPIIRMLNQMGCVVHIASSGEALHLLKKEFQNLVFVELPSYSARYSKYLPFMLNVLLQVPKFLFAIIKERRVVENYINKYPQHLLISDNRYGCRVAHVTSVIICHHISIIMPSYLRWIEGTINYFHRLLINKFDECWIPDSVDSKYSGRLSNPSPANSKFIGILSRFNLNNAPILKYTIAVILSGPEPQRSLFEKSILKQLFSLDLNSIVVRGTLKPSSDLSNSDKIQVIDFADSDSLQEIINSAALVVCRSGFSSVMDLAVLGKKAIFVPTPGQTEQEYLAVMLKDKKIAYTQHQNQFDLKSAIQRSNGYVGFAPNKNDQQLLRLALESSMS